MTPNRKFLSALALISLAYAASGCSLNQYLVVPEVQSPDLPREEDGIIGEFGTLPAAHMTLLEGLNGSAPSAPKGFDAFHDRRDVIMNSGFQGGAYKAVSKGLALGLGVASRSLLPSGIAVRAKLQLIGDQGVLAQTGTLVTLSARGGIHAGVPVDACGGCESLSSSSSFYNLALSVGYPVTPWAIPFVGAGIGNASAEGSAKYTSGPVVYTNSFDARVISVGGGIQFRPNYGARIHLNFNHFETEGLGANVSDSAVTFLLQFGFQDAPKTGSI